MSILPPRRCRRDGGTARDELGPAPAPWRAEPDLAEDRGARPGPARRNYAVRGSFAHHWGSLCSSCWVLICCCGAECGATHSATSRFCEDPTHHPPPTTVRDTHMRPGPCSRGQAAASAEVSATQRRLERPSSGAWSCQARLFCTFIRTEIIIDGCTLSRSRNLLKFKGCISL